MGEEITTDLFTEVGQVLGSSYGRAIMARDPRMSGDMLMLALASGFVSSGGDVSTAGMVSTPTLARAAEDFDCGLMITASHNPPEYNGLKMWNSDGSSFGPSQMNGIERALDEKRFVRREWRGLGEVSRHRGAVESHMEAIMEDLGQVELEVVVDCGCGATSNITPLLLRRMGMGVSSLNAHPDGHFPARPSEPAEGNLLDLKELVVSRGADLGIAHDGDGDRMVAVDDRGRFVGGDRLLALFASRAEGGIATPINSSMILDEITAGEVVRTRVGDVYVSQCVKEKSLAFGGEPSGTYIFPHQTLCPDGVYAAAYLAMMAEGEPLSEMIDTIPSYPVIRESYPFERGSRADVERRLKEDMEGLECDEMLTLDGYRAEFEEGWFLIRLSGTEPKVRLTAEARSEDELRRLHSISESIVKGCLK